MNQNTTYQFRNKAYVLRGTDGDRVVIEPVPNPELETEYVAAAIFYATAKAFPTEANTEKKEPAANHGANQQQISGESAANQPQISRESAANQNETKPKRHVPNPKSVSALETARKNIAQNPYEVMQAYWPIIQEIDRRFDIEKAQRFSAFPRKTAKQLNAMFGLSRDQNFYLRLIGYYTRYTSMFQIRILKRSVQVPMWYLKLEIFIETKIFQNLMD